MEIAFDLAKRAKTLAERGLDFVDAADVLATAIAAFEDRRLDYPEPRTVTFGLLNGRLLAVVTTPTDNGIRVISMRKANAREQAKYRKRMD